MVRLLCLAFLLISPMLMATQAPAQQTLRVGVGWVKPPYIILRGDTGYELDMIKAIFKSMNQPIRLFYQPHSRGYKMMQTGKIDAMLTVNGKINLGSQATLSNPYITYLNVAISVRSPGIRLNQIEDLSRYSVISFNKASEVLGTRFAKAVKQSPLYEEISDQYKQVDMFYQGRSDVIVMDLNIFQNLTFDLYGNRPRPPIEVHRIFPANPYSVAFNDPGLRKKFNKALANYLNSKQHKALLKKYHLTPVLD